MARSTDVSFDCPRCGAQQVIEVEREAAENYGADADGNRGIWQAAYYPTPDAPTACTDCKAPYTEEEQREIYGILERKCEQASEDIGSDDW
jgi:hypothetical protein